MERKEGREQEGGVPDMYQQQKGHTHTKCCIFKSGKYLKRVCAVRIELDGCVSVPPIAKSPTPSGATKCYNSHGDLPVASLFFCAAFPGP